MKYPRLSLRRLKGAVLCGLVGMAVLAGTTSCGVRQSFGPIRIGGALDQSFPVAPVIPPRGYIFTMFDAPLDYRMNKDGQGTVVETSKSGFSETHYIGLPYYSWISVAWGDGSLAESARQGGITTVNYADYKLLNVIGVYANLKIVAYGE